MKTLTFGSIIDERRVPLAVAAASPSAGVLGSIIRLDGRASRDPDSYDLTYAWSFESTPIGSQVGQEGFRILEPDKAVVSFSPDIVGEYVIRLTVSNGVFESAPLRIPISIRAILVPHGRSLVPDGKFIWSYLRDAWMEVEGREFFETLWSALIQIVGADLLKAYQVDFNKSIRDIQDQLQRRWLAYEPVLPLDESSLTLGTHTAGMDGTTDRLGLSGRAIILNAQEVIIVGGTVLPSVANEILSITFSRSTKNLGTYTVAGLNSAQNGYRLLRTENIPEPGADRVATDFGFIFGFQSTTWAVGNQQYHDYAELMSREPAPVDYLSPLISGPPAGIGLLSVGDVIHYPTGPNAGFYRILRKTGSFIIVDHAPPSSSGTTGSYGATVYRPVGFTLSQPDSAVTNVISVPYDEKREELLKLPPGRLVVALGRAFTLLRVTTDFSQRVPLILLYTNQESVPSDLDGVVWRVPHTLSSETQDFESLGVSPGDVVIVELSQEGFPLGMEIPLQVVGVDRNRIGFVLSTDPLTPGEIPGLPAGLLENIAEKFGIEGVYQGPRGLLFSSEARQLYDEVRSGMFQRTFWNVALGSKSGIRLGARTFYLRPRRIIRNRLLPVDDTLRSIPLLQEFFVQPTIVERAGKIYQIAQGQEIERASRPALLTENTDFILDAELAFEGEMTFRTGVREIEVDDGDFVDRGLVAGDQFIIDSPYTLAGIYTIQGVLGRHKLLLSRSTPRYVLSEWVSAQVRIKRRRGGRFLRFVPGRFTPKTPAPARLWAEVSFFDNSQAIEDNFGILVGLTKAELDAVTTKVSYRQAVAGLMFAYMGGSAVDRVRLGVQILLGLPFAEHRGVIRSIDEDYRLDVRGTPVTGRILVEDVDGKGQPLGTQRVYTYPVDPDSRLAGIELNPKTRQRYETGDFVELFAPLGKGVEVIDYITEPVKTSALAVKQLQQFHTLQIRANDNIFSPNELALLSTFLRKITPSHISFALATASEFADDVPIQDMAVLTSHLHLADDTRMGLPEALKFDATSPEGLSVLREGEGMAWVRRSGSDLITIDGSLTVSCAAGGFLLPRTHERFEGPLLRPGDLLRIHTGINAGRYLILSLTDTSLTVQGPTLGFEWGEGLSYSVVRLVRNPLRAGVAEYTGGDPLIRLGGGLRTDGVMPGDWLVLDTGAFFPNRFLITGVEEGVEGSGIYDRVRVLRAPPVTGLADYRIARPGLFQNFSELGAITSDGTEQLVSMSPMLRGLSEIGDLLQLQQDDLLSLLVLDPASRIISPPIPAGTYPVRLVKRGRPTTTFGWNHRERFGLQDALEVALVCPTPDAITVSGSKEVLLGMAPDELGTRVGDLLQLLSGADSSVDVGHGPGVYPVVQVLPDRLRLGVPLLGAASAVPWKILRRR